MNDPLIKGGAGLLLATAVWLAPLAGHASTNDLPTGGYSHDPLQDQADTTAVTAVTLPPTSTGYLPDDKHSLREGDQVSFQIIEDRDPAKNLIVTDSGELDIPYVGRVMCEGKTCRQLAEELKVLLEKEYYYRATVVLGLNEASKTRGRVYIWGEVRKQGPVDIPADEKFTVGKAIMQAGGFADFANKKKVKLVRTAADGSKTTTELNLVDILEKGKTDQDLTVHEDDFIIVPSRLINF